MVPYKDPWAVTVDPLSKTFKAGSRLLETSKILEYSTHECEILDASLNMKSHWIPHATSYNSADVLLGSFNAYGLTTTHHVRSDVTIFNL